MNREFISEKFRLLQDHICGELEIEDGKAKFQEDLWERSEGGGGRTRIIQHGNAIEKGGVNYSAVFGPTPEKILAALNLKKSDFFATGVSIVMHPVNPWSPIIHMNVRYFEMSDGTWWFGGGIDLTPHYVIDEDAKFFHAKLKEVCDKHDRHYYPEFKDWADNYFYIKHRSETRGIGGIFFDRLNETRNKPKEEQFNFVMDVGNVFAPVYRALLERNKNKPYSENELKWQRLRRGRYVEFNLVYDKGTKFGLDTDGRTESILMSLPPMATWEYAHVPSKNSPEGETINKLSKGINWSI